MTLDLDARLTAGTLAVDAAFTVGDGEVVALLGPNGAGKTTLVRAVAGLHALDHGHIAVDGVAVDEPATGTFRAPDQRSVGVVFQDLLLFPRLSAIDNVAFGLRANGSPRRDAAGRAAEWLDRLGVLDVADRRPAALSGGEAQRVALARALATEPRVLLLDEPLAALDASARIHVRAELRSHLAIHDGARLLVTHDPIDALVLADRLVILEDGRITQTGTPAEVAARPATRYAADLVGINILHGRLSTASVVRIDDGAELHVGDTHGAPVGAHVTVALRPRSVSLHPEAPHGSPRNAWPATVSDLEADRDRVRVSLDGPVPLTAEVTAAAVTDLGLTPGTEIWAAVKAVDLDVYER